jgi:hypothetical protein
VFRHVYNVVSTNVSDTYDLFELVLSIVPLSIVL